MKATIIVFGAIIIFVIMFNLDIFRKIYSQQFLHRRNFTKFGFLIWTMEPLKFLLVLQKPLKFLPVHQKTYCFLMISGGIEVN